MSQEHTRNTVLARQLESFVRRIETLPNVLPDVLESIGTDRSQNFSPATPNSGTSPALRKQRPTEMSKAGRSITGENVGLATSLQTHIEMLQDAAQVLKTERLKVAALQLEVDGLKRQLEVSMESEQRAVDIAKTCERDCDGLICAACVISRGGSSRSYRPCAAFNV